MDRRPTVPPMAPLADSGTRERAADDERTRRPDPDVADSGGLSRRDFLRTAAVLGAGGVLVPAGLEADAPSGPRLIGARQLPGLGNAEPPAFQFQAYPEGTGALLERLWRDRGTPPFERTPLEPEPWEGPLPTSEADIAFLPAHRLASLIRAGGISSVELTELYLERLRRYDPELLLSVTILEESALSEARQADAELRAGRIRSGLHGVPYGLKDLFAVRGIPTTWGSDAFQEQVIDEDAEIVVRLREAGAVLVAKLATGEFALGDLWFRGRTRNPWNPEEGASGSSAGPGAAVAAGCVGFAIGTETQGSIVSPSRRNGITALRPTFGRVSRHGGMVLAWSMDKPGPMCRSAEDCAHVFRAIHGVDGKDPSTLTAPFEFDREIDLSTVRIGYRPDAPEVFLDALAEMGAEPEPVPPMPGAGPSPIAAESAAAFEFHVAPDGEPDPLPPGLDEAEVRRQTRFTRGREVTAVEYLQAERERYRTIQAMSEAMEGFDLYVSGNGDIALTNLTGHPCVVLPYEFGPREPGDADSTRMPRTTILVGDLFQDDLLLAVAHRFQRDTDWHLRRPPLS